MVRELLFDTGALIDIYKGRSRITPYLQAIEIGTLAPYLSVLSEVELWQGMRERETRQHEALMTLFQALPLRSDVARTAGRWRQRYHEQGLGWMDAFIAATAQQAGMPLLSRDRRLAICLVDELEIEVYS